jgi:hypothetical protein
MDDKSERMLCRCPHGHKLRGSVELIGESVRCPRCNEKFVFGYQIRESISDTAVVRILGDAPPSSRPNSDSESQDDEGLCDRCGGPVSRAAGVCNPCQNSSSTLPDFFSQLRGGSDSSIN